ncbi:hypothetical protein [Chitinophaga pinensis]|uniref:hypothetical protein n=1 Tax=Chitinophaga pinensis TaxID=79329 RepID=UPI001C99D9FE|nr:hypothetical protein [Chitinophaga pinensis]
MEEYSADQIFCLCRKTKPHIFKKYHEIAGAIHFYITSSGRRMAVCDIAGSLNQKNMSESFSKKELRNKKAKAKQDKAQRKEERKNNNNKGKSLEDMLAYVDENGNLSPVPPSGNAGEIALSDINIGATPRPEEDPTRTGVVSFLTFLKDLDSSMMIVRKRAYFFT